MNFIAAIQHATIGYGIRLPFFADGVYLIIKTCGVLVEVNTNNENWEREILWDEYSEYAIHTDWETL